MGVKIKQMSKGGKKRLYFKSQWLTEQNMYSKKQEKNGSKFSGSNAAEENIDFRGDYDLAVIPIFWSTKSREHEAEQVIQKAQQVKDQLANAGISAVLDKRRRFSPGQKLFYWEKRGVNVRIEIGPKELENNQCIINLKQGVGAVGQKSYEALDMHLVSKVRQCIDQAAASTSNVQQQNGASADQNDGKVRKLKRKSKKAEQGQDSKRKKLGQKGSNEANGTDETQGGGEHDGKHNKQGIKQNKHDNKRSKQDTKQTKRDSKQSKQDSKQNKQGGVQEVGSKASTGSKFNTNDSEDVGQLGSSHIKNKSKQKCDQQNHSHTARAPQPSASRNKAVDNRKVSGDALEDDFVLDIDDYDSDGGGDVQWADMDGGEQTVPDVIGGGAQHQERGNQRGKSGVKGKPKQLDSKVSYYNFSESKEKRRQGVEQQNKLRAKQMKVVTF